MTAGGFPPPGDQSTNGYGSPPPGYTPPSSSGQPSPGPPRYDGWAPPAPWAPTQVQQPGVVPLRPLGLGDIFDGAIKTIRANPQATIGLALLVEAVFLLPSLLLTAWIARSSFGGFEGAAELGDAVMALLPSIASAAAGLLLTGLVIFVVSEAVLGRKAGIGPTWGATRGRLLPLIGVNVVTAVILVVAVVVLLVPAFVLAGVASSSASSEGSVGGAIALGVLGGLLAVLAVIWLGVRLSMAGAVVVLERTGVFAALGRSWRLTRGKAFWRILGITVLAAIVAAIVSSIFAIPAGFVSGSALFGTGAPGGSGLLAPVVDHAAQLLGGALTTPFTAGVACLLYLDQRIRREALDVTLMHAAREQPAGPSPSGR